MLKESKKSECDEIHQEKLRKMGSLPNLHELGKHEDEIGGYKPGPALGHLCGGGCNAILSAEEKAKLFRTPRFLQRYTGHQKIKKATSNPHEYSTKVNAYDDEAAELATRKKLKEGYNKEMMERYFRNYASEYSPTSGSIPQPPAHFRESFSRRRRDSWNSSGGTSTRRLCLDRISNILPKPTDPEISQVFTRRQILRRITFTCICHFFFWCAHGPFLALQSSISVWTSNDGSSVNMNAGSQLVALAYLTAAVTSLVAPVFTALKGAFSVTSCCFSILPLVYSMHLSNTLTPYLPIASVLYGWHLGFISSGHSSHLFVLAHRMTRLFHGGDEDRIQARRTTIIRRFFRAFQASQDLGLLIGSLATALMITFTLNLEVANEDVTNSTIVTTEDCSFNSSLCQNITQPLVIREVIDYNQILDDIFEKSENSRICGIQACPVNDIPLNTTLGSLRWENKIIPNITARTLMAVYCFLSVVCFVLFWFGDKHCLKMYLCPRISEQILSGKTLFKTAFGSYKSFSLKFVNALSFFIGIEQAYIYADFSKYFVVCTLGVHHLNLAFLSMALLQSIANLTLSMLLRTIRRCYVLMVGFLFHACLLLVLYMWKPAEDDPALFYVISAAWGVCNAIWEMLVLTFLAAKYPDNWDAPFAWTFFLKYSAMALMFLLHSTTCGQLKLLLLAVNLFIAVSMFLCMDLSEFASKRAMTRL